MTPAKTLPGRQDELRRFARDAYPPSTWQRLCPDPACWQDELLQRLVDELDASRDELLELDDAEQYPQALLDRLRAAGMMRIYADDPDQPRTTVWHINALNDAFARRTTSIAIASGINALGLLPAWVAATPQQLEQINARVREGAFSSLLLTELEHGSNLLRNRATAERGRLGDDGAFEPVGPDEEATHYRVQGEKNLINGANQHHQLFTLLRTRPADEHDEGSHAPLAQRGAHSMFLIERQEGVTNLPRWRTSPAPAADISGAAFDLVVPASTRIGDEGEGFTVAQKTLMISRGGIAGFASGTVSRAHDLVFAYVRERNIYGEPIAALSGIQDHLLRFLALEHCVGATSVRAGVWTNACGFRAALYTGLSKLMGCQLSELAVEEARVVLGGRGLLTELPFAQVSRDVQLFGVFDGTSHVMLEELQTRLTSDVRRWRKGQDAERDTVAELREMIGLPARRLSVLLRERNKRRTFLLPLHAARLSALCGDQDQGALAELALAVYALVDALSQAGSWRDDAGLRLQVARTYALVETLTAVVEFVDPGRRQALGAPTLLAQVPTDSLIARFAVAWLGNQALGELELSAAWGGLDAGWELTRLPQGLQRIRQDLLRDLPGVRAQLATQIAEL